MDYELLEEIIKEEAENLRKLCFKHKRRKFIEEDILKKIVEDEHIICHYKPVGNEKDYIHMLIINKVVLKDKNKLSQIVRHLLIQAFCREYFYIFNGAYKNNSYILLAMLQFLKNTNKSKYYLNYKNSILYSKVKDVESFDELQLVILIYYNYI